MVVRTVRLREDSTTADTNHIIRFLRFSKYLRLVRLLRVGKLRFVMEDVRARMCWCLFRWCRAWGSLSAMGNRSQARLGGWRTWLVLVLSSLRVCCCRSWCVQGAGATRDRRAFRFLHIRLHDVHLGSIGATLRRESEDAATACQARFVTERGEGVRTAAEHAGRAESSLALALKVVKLSCILMIVTHFAACLWYFFTIGPGAGWDSVSAGGRGACRVGISALVSAALHKASDMVEGIRGTCEHAPGFAGDQLMPDRYAVPTSVSGGFSFIVGERVVCYRLP